jgi:hypothetical protein
MNNLRISIDHHALFILEVALVVLNVVIFLFFIGLLALFFRTKHYFPINLH